MPVKNVTCIVTYTSSLKTKAHYRRLSLKTRSGSRDRSEPDVAIKAYARLGHVTSDTRLVLKMRATAGKPWRTIIRPSRSCDVYLAN